MLIVLSLIVNTSASDCKERDIKFTIN